MIRVPFGDQSVGCLTPADRGRTPDNLIQRQRTARELVGRRLSFEQLHDRVAIADVVEGADVRVVELDGLRLSKRNLSCAFCASSAGRTLMATLRSSRVSRARHTSPISRPRRSAQRCRTARGALLRPGSFAAPRGSAQLVVEVLHDDQRLRQRILAHARVDDELLAVGRLVVGHGSRPDHE